MCDSDSLENESEQNLAKAAKSHNDQSSDSSQSIQQLSKWSQSNIVEAGHSADQLNTRHRVNTSKKRSQQKYREQNREKLKQREAERRKRKQNLQCIVDPSTSSNINRTEFNNEEITDANSQSLSGFEEAPTITVQENEQDKKRNALQKKRERQQRYRERKKEKLKQREAERRQRQLNLEIIGEITDANSQSLSGLEGSQTSSVQENKQAKEKNALQKKRERQKRYREQNREKLKQRELERRKRQQNLEIIAESSTSSNIDCVEILCEPIIDSDEMSTNSLSEVVLCGFEETQNLFGGITEGSEGSQASSYETQISNNYSKFSCHKFAHKCFDDNIKNDQFGLQVEEGSKNPPTNAISKIKSGYPDRDKKKKNFGRKKQKIIYRNNTRFTFTK